MQTFLPYPDFAKSASVLDYRRLGKQRVETWQILNAIRNGTGWRHHPAVKMWKEYESALVEYGIAICLEWVDRGYNDVMLGRFLAMQIVTEKEGKNVVLPRWLENRRFHNSHRSNLLRKFPEHYRQYWPRLTNDLPYVWPV